MSMMSKRKGLGNEYIPGCLLIKRQGALIEFPGATFAKDESLPFIKHEQPGRMSNWSKHQGLGNEYIPDCLTNRNNGRAH